MGNLWPMLRYGLFLAVLALATSEIALRFLSPAAQRYYVWPPNMHVVFQPSAQATPGIEGPGHFITNSLGLRSDEPLADRKRTIYVFGGSTAADVYLDQREAWITVLQDRLNAIAGQPRTWVGNLGRSSLASLHALLQFEHLVPSLPRTDPFVNLTGWNDFQMAIKSSYLADMTMEDHMSWTFSQRPTAGKPWQSLATVRFYHRLDDWWKRSRVGVQQTHTADGYITWRGCRQSVPKGTFIDALPDLTAALATYRRNLERLADMAAAYGAPLVLATQPMLWKEVMPPEDEALLYTGGLGPNNVWCKELRYYSSTALARGVAQFNAATLEVCRARGLHCIDLASRMPRIRKHFWDDGHFNEEGARFAGGLVAEEIARLGLGNRGPGANVPAKVAR